MIQPIPALQGYILRCYIEVQEDGLNETAVVWWNCGTAGEMREIENLLAPVFQAVGIKAEFVWSSVGLTDVDKSKFVG